MEVLQYENSRNSLFDIAKGLFICFVVAGHCYAPYYQFYTSFHVLFFFILAGVFFKDKYITTINDLKSYIIKIWRRYAIPYILCNISFLAFYNFFIQHHIITHDNRIQTIHYLTSNDIILKMVQHCLLISSSEQLCGATWFLRTLFFVLFILAIINYISIKVRKNVFIFYGIILCFSFFVTSYFANRSLFIFLSALDALLLGNILKRINSENNNANIVFSNIFYTILILLFSFLIILKTEVIQFEIVGSWIYSLFGTVFLYSFSILLKKIINNLYKMIVYIGQHTLPIFCLHFLAFKLVSYIYIKKYSLDMVALGDFPILTLHQMPNLTLFYILIGILLPILLDFFYKNILIYRRTNVKN